MWIEPDDLNLYTKIELKMNELCDLEEDEDLTSDRRSFIQAAPGIS